MKDDLYENYLRAFSLFNKQIRDIWDRNQFLDYDGDNGHDSPVQSHAIPTKPVQAKRPLLDLSRCGEPSFTPSYSPSPKAAPMQGGARFKTTSSAHRPETNVGDLVQQLQHAILTGNSSQARQISDKLSQQRAHLNIDVDLDVPTSPRGQEIMVNICVEDRKTSMDPFQLKLPTSIKISQLKKRMYLDYGIIPEVQRWIIGKRMAKDGQTLAQCGANMNGATIFLYLLSRQTVGLSDDEYKRKYGHLLATPDPHRPKPVTGYPQKDPKPAVTPAPAVVDPRIQRQLQREILGGRTADIPTRAAPKPSVQKRPPEVVPQMSREGWPCPVCTYLELWTRDACGVCRSSRPENLRPPPNPIIPNEERQRLERVRLEEEKLRAAQEGTLELTERDLDLMLRLTVQQREENTRQMVPHSIDEPESLSSSQFNSTVSDGNNRLVHRDIGFESDLEVDDSSKRSTPRHSDSSS